MKEHFIFSEYYFTMLLLKILYKNGVDEIDFKQLELYLLEFYEDEKFKDLFHNVQLSKYDDYVSIRMYILSLIYFNEGIEYKNNKHEKIVIKKINYSVKDIPPYFIQLMEMLVEKIRINMKITEEMKTITLVSLNSNRIYKGFNKYRFITDGNYLVEENNLKIFDSTYVIKSYAGKIIIYSKTKELKKVILEADNYLKNNLQDKIIVKRTLM